MSSPNQNFEVRSHLFDQLSALPQPQFERVRFALEVPPSVMSGPAAPPGTRVSNLLDWAESPTGCGLARVKAELESLAESTLKADKTCQNSQALTAYLATTLKTLREHGCLDACRDIHQEHCRFHTVARIQDFELSFGLFAMRGEAFFVFSEFRSIQIQILRRFSKQALVYARQNVDDGATGDAIYNFRMPTHVCFAVALVDELDAATKEAIHTTNPFARQVYALWYEVPVVCELNQAQLHFYDQPSGFWENFRGEIAWQQLRKAIQELLSPGLESQQ